MPDSLPENSLESFVQEGIDALEATNRMVEQGSIQIHKVFAQNEDGAALLAQWKEQLIMVPSIKPNSTQFEAGMAEGTKHFIRSLIIQIKKFEDETSGA